MSQKSPTARTTAWFSPDPTNKEKSQPAAVLSCTDVSLLKSLSRLDPEANSCGLMLEHMATKGTSTIDALKAELSACLDSVNAPQSTSKLKSEDEDVAEPTITERMTAELKQTLPYLPLSLVILLLLYRTGRLSPLISAVVALMGGAVFWLGARETHPTIKVERETITKAIEVVNSTVPECSSDTSKLIETVPNTTERTGFPWDITAKLDYHVLGASTAPSDTNTVDLLEYVGEKVDNRLVRLVAGNRACAVAAAPSLSIDGLSKILLADPEVTPPLQPNVEILDEGTKAQIVVKSKTKGWSITR
jgi:hypothetical protein